MVNTNSEQLNVCIIDDESASIKVLSHLLVNNCQNVKIVAHADSIDSGINSLSRIEIDLLFLDIQMPKGSGFTILNALENRSFDVVFITAFEDYAIEAIRNRALAYLLKPIDIEELQHVISLAKKEKYSRSLQKIAKSISQITNLYPTNISVPTGKGQAFIDAKKIIRVEAERNYSYIYISDKQKKLLASMRLGQIEKLLQTDNFIRIHKSHIVNLNYLTEYLKIDGGLLKLSDGTIINIGESYKSKVIKRINEINLF